MFTGIIEEIGIIEKIFINKKNIILAIDAPKSYSDLKINDSVAINGVCQTVINKKGSTFYVEAVEETLRKTNFQTLKPNDKVNIELPTKINSRLGGHILSGHVDCVGNISDIQEKNGSWIFTISFPKSFSKYTIPVGSIAVDGVSLTIAHLKNNKFDVSIIPHTMENTIFQYYKVGKSVNLEFDLIGKYIESIITNLEYFKKNNKLNESDLRKSGF